jgi:hypothetical protein
VNRTCILLGLAILLAGCAGRAQTPPGASAAAAQPSTSAGEPRTVTDLSQISPSGKIAVPMPEPGSPLVPADAASNRDPNATMQQNIERLVVANASQTRYREGRAEAPGETNLLNDKAHKFSEFSYQLLNQTLTAARALEPDRLEGRKLPIDIAPTVLTAIMDSQGRLTEISIEAHSGDRQVDQIIIDSCKQGLWSRNPPAPALDNDGKYRVRVRGHIRAYTFDYKGQYHYDTELGLGIL